MYGDELFPKGSTDKYQMFVMMAFIMSNTVPETALINVNIFNPPQVHYILIKAFRK